MGIEASFLKAFDVILDHVDLVVVGRVLLGLGQVLVDEGQQTAVVAGGHSEVRTFELNLKIKETFKLFLL